MESKNPAVERYNAKKRKKKQRRKYFFYTFLVIFSVTVITVLSLTVFFNISDIAVTGNSRYSSEQIVGVSGLVKGQNLFRLNKFKIIETLKHDLPYIRNVKIDRHLPVGIEIIVEESDAYMCVGTDSGIFILNSSLKVLEQTEEAPPSLPLVVGVSDVNAKIGEMLTGEGTQYENLARLATALENEIGAVTGINLERSYDVTFEYENRITVKLGTLEKLSDKLALVKYVLEQNRSNEFAVIDVSGGKRAYYRSVIPEKETETEPEPESEPDEE